MLKALVFDVDGTLADTEETHRCAYNAAFVEHGLGLVLDAPAIRCLACHQRRSGTPALRHPPPALESCRAGAFTAAGTDRASDQNPTICRFCRCRPCPPAARHRALDWRGPRAAGLELALVSSTTPANIDALLSANLGDEARRWFRVLADGEHCAQRKPAPDIFKLALAQLAQPAANCVAFEDSATGVAAAAVAGLYTSPYRTRGTPARPLAPPISSTNIWVNQLSPWRIPQQLRSAPTTCNC